MTEPCASVYHRHRFPAEIIAKAAWLVLSCLRPVYAAQYDAGPDVVRENRSLSHCRAVDAQDNTTGSSARAVHSALLSHHTIVTPPTVVPERQSFFAFVYLH